MVEVNALVGGDGTKGQVAQNQVAFGADGNTVSGTNAFWWDDADKRFGVWSSGQAAPAYRAHIVDLAAGSDIGLTIGAHFDDGTTSALRLQKSRGSFAIPESVQIGDYIGDVKFYGHDGSNYVKGAQFGAWARSSVGAGSVPMGFYWALKSSGLSADPIGNNEALMRLNTTGLGVGPAVPLAKLHLQDSSAGTSDIVGLSRFQREPPGGNAASISAGWGMADSWRGYDQGGTLRILSNQIVYWENATAANYTSVLQFNAIDHAYGSWSPIYMSATQWMANFGENGHFRITSNSSSSTLGNQVVVNAQGVTIGSPAPNRDVTSSARLHVADDGVGTRGFLLGQHNDASDGVLVQYNRSHGTDHAPAAVASGDYGTLILFNHWTTTYKATAFMGTRITGAPAGSSVATSLWFGANNAGSTDPYASNRIFEIAHDGTKKVGWFGVGAVAQQALSGSTFVDWVGSIAATLVNYGLATDASDWVIGPTIAGTIAAGQVAFGTATDTIGGSASFTWSSALGSLSVIQAAGVNYATDRANLVLKKGLANNAAALEIWDPGASGEFFVRIYEQGATYGPPGSGQIDQPALYVNAGAGFYTRKFVIISGTVTGTDASYRISPPLDPGTAPHMLGVHADVADALIVRAASSGNRLWRGVNAAGSADTSYLTDTGVLSIGTDLAGGGKSFVVTAGTPNAVLTSTAATDYPRYRAATHDPYVMEMGVGSSAAGTPYAGLTVTNKGYLYCSGVELKIFLATGGPISLWTDSAERFRVTAQMKGLASGGVTGSAAAPVYTDTTANSGLWFPGANKMALSANGVEIFRGDATGLSFYAHATVGQQTVTGSLSGSLSDVVSNMLAALAATGIFINGVTA